MPACKSECTPTSPPITTRSCRGPRYGVPAESARDLRYIRMGRAPSLPRASLGRALQVLAAPGFPDEFPAIHDHLAPREHGARVAFHLEALEHRRSEEHTSEL